jgi:hypothetical protein
MTARSLFLLSVALLCCLLLDAQFGVHAAAPWQIENRVAIEHGTVLIDHTKSVKEITAAQTKGGFKASLGVGLFQNRLKMELAFDEVSLPGRRVFLSTRITTAPVIYIARELPKDSCAYRLVLGHEMLHQDYDLEVLRTMPDEIRRMTRNLVSIDELERSSGLNQARLKAQFFQQFNHAYQALGERWHPMIDSPESYRRLGEMCNGEVGQLLGARK